MHRQAVMARLRLVLPSVLMLVFVIAYLVTAYQTLDQDSRHLPVLTAYLTVCFLLMDLFASLSGRNKSRESSHNGPGVTLLAEVKGIVSLISLVVGVYFFGFYAAGLLYILLAIWWLGQQPLRFAIIISLST